MWFAVSNDDEQRNQQRQRGAQRRARQRARGYVRRRRAGGETLKLDNNRCFHQSNLRQVINRRLDTFLALRYVITPLSFFMACPSPLNQHLLFILPSDSYHIVFAFCPIKYLVRTETDPDTHLSFFQHHRFLSFFRIPECPIFKKLSSITRTAIHILKARRSSLDLPPEKQGTLFFGWSTC